MNNKTPAYEDPVETSETTHFGYQEVPVREKTRKVAQVFHSVAGQYDLMNDLMSFGIHRLWKRFAINCLQVQKGDQVLDLAGGTGDLTAHLSHRVGNEGQVVLADINASMLARGRERLLNQGLGDNIQYIQADAERLPFPDNYFNCIVIGFGLRNVTRKKTALSAMYRVLKPGGELLILEFSKPQIPLLKTCYDAYSFNILPRLGRLITGDAQSYQYLAESIRKHPDQETLKALMHDVGFQQVRYHNLTGGIVAIHQGYKL